MNPASDRQSAPTEAEREAERLRQEQDDYLDEALKETFPASDPIAPGRPHPKQPGHAQMRHSTIDKQRI